jgi:hypothetical protein
MRRAACLATAAFALAIALVLPATVGAKVPIYSVISQTSSTQAGGHPDVLVGVEVATPNGGVPPTEPCFCNAIRDLIVQTPPGLVAAPGDIPQCTSLEFATGRCPVDSQVGIVDVRLTPEEDQGGNHLFQPLYNMEAREGKLALLATTAPIVQTPIYTEIFSRTESDYGLEFRTFGIPSIAPPSQLTQINWGVPTDPFHDTLRFPFEANKTVYCGAEAGTEPIPELFAGEFPQVCGGGEFNCGLFFAPKPCTGPPPTVNSAAIPFISNPTTCTGPLDISAETFGYDLESDFLQDTYPEVTGCDKLNFDPSLSAEPTTTETDAPSGLDVELSVPQTLSPSTPTSSSIRASSVTLPPGFTINSNAADGKLSCSDQQARFGSREPAECPEYSKIGTLAVLSSSFPSVLPGAMYLGEPLTGNRYRIFLVFDGFSLHVKIAGKATLDPATGQVTTTFTDLPQFTFQDFNLHFFGAERGILATPTQCGTYPVKSTFTPWAAELPQQTSTQFFTIDSGPGGTPCPGTTRPFDPNFAAGVVDNTAGVHTPFVLRLDRPDGDQNLTGLDVTTPPGFSATLKGVPYCPESAIAQLADSDYSGVLEQTSPACPAASRIGSVSASAGAGSRPVHVGGQAYLAGPYKGAPLSLVIVIPAVSGPYDLGNVAVRAALFVDPLTAQVHAVSDPLPQILEGIPLRTRSIQINLDRSDANGNPDFTLNPTNCEQFSVDAAVHGDQGALLTRSSHFQVANCADLPYGPKLTLKLTGGVKRLGHPAIHAAFRAQPGEANTRKVTVTLPPGELLDQSHIGTVCTKVDFAKNSCPAGSVLGSAEVTTPILDQPLSGRVYLRSSSKGLPDLAIDLEGQVDFELVGQVDSVNARYRTTFKTVPDVPVGTFKLDLLGGGKGLLQNSESLCGGPKKASVKLRGQNGAALDTKVGLQVPCGASGRHARHRHHRGDRGGRS